MFWITLAVLFFIFGIIEAYVIFNLNRKTSIYENWINQFTETVKVVDEELDRIDEEATFRADDEIGYFYQALYSIIKRLSEIGLIDEETGELNGKEQNLFYERDREIKRRIENRKQDNITMNDIIDKKYKPEK